MKFIKLFEQFTNDNTLFNKIRSDYFNNDVLDFSLKQRDGYLIIDNKVVFGTVLENLPDVEYLFHEMGHFVLFKDYSRLLINSYGLDYPKTQDGYDMPISWTGIKNETRAVIFQSIIAKKYNFKLDTDGWLKSLRLMEDFINVPVFNGYKNINDENNEYDYDWYDNITKEKIPFKEMEKRRILTLKHFFEAESLLPRYTLDNFNSEWFKRVEYLENNLKND